MGPPGHGEGSDYEDDGGDAGDDTDVTDSEGGLEEDEYDAVRSCSEQVAELYQTRSYSAFASVRLSNYRCGQWWSNWEAVGLASFVHDPNWTIRLQKTQKNVIKSALYIK